ncbi:MAG: two-component sensor histidine kinase, partial [Chitinophagaceae bacterium]
MFFLQVTPATSTENTALLLGTIGMLVLVTGLILFIIFHQRKVIRYQTTLQTMEQEQQKMLLNASVKLQ